MKNSNDTIGNRTRDPSTCSAVPQLNGPPRAAQSTNGTSNIKIILKSIFLNFRLGHGTGHSESPAVLITGKVVPPVISHIFNQI